MIGIYKITNPNGKVYIGQSRNIKKRFKKYKTLKCKNQIKLYNSLLKYGYDNHIFEIVEECIFEELNNKERYFQDFYNVLENGLNCMLTKTNDLPLIFSQETKNKLSEKSKIRKHSLETINYLKEINKKENHPNFGRKFSEKHIENMSLSKIGKKNYYYNKKHTDEIRNKMILNNKNSKKVIDKETNIIYSSALQASKQLNIKYSTLYKWLNNDFLNKTSLKWC